MDGIFKFFSSLADIISSVIDFVINLFKDLVYVLKLLVGMSAKIPDLIGWLPSSIVALIVTGISVVVIYKFIGRD